VAVKQVCCIDQPALTEKLKASIRRLAQQGMRQGAIAIELRVSQSTVSRVLRNER